VTDILTPARRGLPYALAGPFRSFERNVVLVTLVPLAVMLLHATAVGLPLVAGIAVALGTPHVLATFGLYGDSELREVVRSDRVRLVWLPLLAIPMSALAFYVVNGSALLWLFTAFLIWQTHHFTKQNFGMVTFWTKARSLPGPTVAEKRLIKATTLVGGLGILRAVGEVPQHDALLRSAGLVLLALGTVAILATWAGTRSVALLVVLAFYAPLHLFEADLFAAAVAYQSAHGAQYYLMVGHVMGGDRSRSNRWPAVAALVLVVALGGAALVAATRPSTTSSGRLAFGAAKGVVAAHFIADARLWRLRDPQVRTIMRRRFEFL